MNRRPASISVLSVAALFLPSTIAQPADFCFGTIAAVTIQFDNYPEETSWDIVNAYTDQVLCSGGGSGDGITGASSSAKYAYECCLDDDNDDGTSGDDGNHSYTFTIRDSYGDGICCEHGSGSFSVRVRDDDGMFWRLVVDSGINQSFDSEYSTTFTLEDYSDIDDTTLEPTYWPVQQPTAQPANWGWPTATSSPTLYPTDVGERYEDRYHCPPNEYYSYHSEFDGCITPNGCAFKATPYEDSGSFLIDACWTCCTSPYDDCGMCGACVCGYNDDEYYSNEPTQYPLPWDTIEPTNEPTQYFSDSYLARKIWTDANAASRGEYPWYEEDDCIQHPTHMYGVMDEPYRTVGIVMTNVLRDPRMTKDVEREILFMSWMQSSRQCTSLLDFSQDMLQSGNLDEEVRHSLRAARSSFLERIGNNDDEVAADDDGIENEDWRIALVARAIGLIIAFCCGCLCCFGFVARRRQILNAKNYDVGGASIAVSGSVLSAATVTPTSGGPRSISIPIASAVPVATMGVEDRPPLTAKVIIPVPSNANAGSAAVAGAASVEPSAPPLDASSAVNENDVPVAESQHSLADCVEEAGSFGRTKAINKWMNDNPARARSLSSDAISAALSKVFSLDQSAAAKEIAAGISRCGGSVTCDMVAKAVEVCSSSARLDVAKSMAPFVSDLANEEIILAAFPSSYEREQVDRALNMS